MSDSITGLSNNLTSYDTYTKATSDLKNTLTNTDYSKATDEELMEACRTYES